MAQPEDVEPWNLDPQMGHRACPRGAGVRGHGYWTDGLPALVEALTFTHLRRKKNKPKPALPVV